MAKALVYIIIVQFFLLSCRTDNKTKPALPANNIEIANPKGFPQKAYNFEKNNLTKDGFILGRNLFYDPILSKNNTISCGSCHQQFAAFSHSNHPVSHGIDGKLGTRNAPAMFNMLWMKEFMLDGGINHIEVQPLAPITNPVEMDDNMDNILKKLNNHYDYKKQFETVFGKQQVTGSMVFKALAQFMGMLNSYNSKYDKVKAGELSFTETEQKGYTVFKLKCGSCHTEPLFSDFSYKNNGLDSIIVDEGRSLITQNPSDFGKYKVPSLRNIEVSSPYFHDGSVSSLSMALQHYVNGIKNNKAVDQSLLSLTVSEEEKTQLEAFLKTLTDTEFLKDKRFADPF